MNNFNLVSKILNEAEEAVVQQQPTDIKNDPNILNVKRKAEIIKAKAELMGAHNKIKQVKMDSDKIDAQREEHNREMQAKADQAQPQQAPAGA